MREILFKAVSIDGKWVEGYYVEENGSPGILVDTRIDDCCSRLKWVDVNPYTVCQFSELVTKGKAIKVFESDKWVLHYYSQLINSYVHNSGTIERLKNGRWVCKDETGLNSFDLIDMIEVYEGAFEITGNIHDDKLKGEECR